MGALLRPHNFKNMNRKILFSGVFVFIAGAAVAAGLFFYPYDPKKPPRADDAGATDGGIKQAVEANNEFAFDMYEKIANGRKGNIFFSPYSVSSAMAMVYEGAKGKTNDEIKEVFNFSEYSVLRSNYAAIYNSINKEEKQYELRTGNALWVENNYPLIGEYMDIVEKYYGGKAANVDFIKEPARSVNTINEFIEEQTNGKIENILSSGDVNPLTKLIITNAIYFKGMWESEFDKKLTKAL